MYFCSFAFKCSIKEKNVWSDSGCFLSLNVIQVTPSCLSQWSRGEMSMENRFLKSCYPTVKEWWWWWKANIMIQRANGRMNPFCKEIAIFPLQLWLLFVHTLLGRPYETTINFSFSWSPSYHVLNDAVMTTLQHHQMKSAPLWIKLLIQVREVRGSSDTGIQCQK